MLPTKGDLIIFREGGELIVCIAYVMDHWDFSMEGCKKRRYAFDLWIAGDPGVMHHFRAPYGNIQVTFTCKEIKQYIRKRKWDIKFNTNPLQRYENC